MDIIQYSWEQELAQKSPLALKMRPENLDDFFGQEDILGEGKLLRRLIQADRFSSAVFYGPPGTGKTTAARIIAQTSKARFFQLNAVMSGVKDIKEVIKKAKELLGMEGQRTILFIDEIHRFNKAQQDALLPSVEEGTVILIGATTENPYFTVISPLLSRSTVFPFKPLENQDIEKILERALKDKNRGMASYNPHLEPEALKHIVERSNGDARVALNALELAVLTTEPGKDGIRLITLSAAEESIQGKAVRYDRQGDNHFDVISAFIKSIRGSDPDAALYWLAFMINAGEDPNFIARRLVISASEDVGNADPRALSVAVSAAQALQMIGMPEGRIILAQAATYLASAPKSNASYLGINQALEEVKVKSSGGVPPYLKDASYPGARKMGHGKGYKYPHDYAGNFVLQHYLPQGIREKIYYRPSENGEEKMIKWRLEKLWPKRKGR
ncbi:replication-associated recombination protein A [Candidatus Contubernalis alkaliaceticus]|uniref:replication-associated recombination protein A n=1 Tax=Candidatus Contubernalis alkaliaceticus TaxID=338645 RepID=UPI001F4C19D8|nr:replication-associated recombination protein A [Candidatus Contubernalis alkalaceticus]UNC92597.1 replication-associated recombination protein A [Candidatus Contubernalis alkalaceticus]